MNKYYKPFVLIISYLVRFFKIICMVKTKSYSNTECDQTLVDSIFGCEPGLIDQNNKCYLYNHTNGFKHGEEIGIICYDNSKMTISIILFSDIDNPDLKLLANGNNFNLYSGSHGDASIRIDDKTEIVFKRNFVYKFIKGFHWKIIGMFSSDAQQGDAPETISP